MTLTEDIKYNDIINFPHHVSKRYPRMSIQMRAAQFAPFAALSGYYDSLNEAARLTNRKINLSDDIKSIIDMKLKTIDEHIKELSEIRVIHFVKDQFKIGGEYIEYTGNLKRIDKVSQELIFTDGFKIKIKNIFDVEIVKTRD